MVMGGINFILRSLGLLLNIPITSVIPINTDSQNWELEGKTIEYIEYI